MSLTYPIQVGSLKKGSHVIIDGFPCKIIDYTTSKPGKHGSAKAHIVGVDIFTGKKHETFGPTGSNILAPFIVKKEYQLLDINDDGYLSLMTDDGDEKCDIKLKEDEIGLKLKKVYANDKDSSSIMVQTICAMDVEQVVDIKVN